MAVRIVQVDERLRKRLRDGISSAERRQLADLLVRIGANAQEALAEQQEPLTQENPQP